MEMATLAVIASGVQAVSAIKQGQFQQAMYNIQAKQAELQGRQNALNYSKQALDVLTAQRRVASSLVARSAAGGIDPFSGSPMSVDQWNAFQAGEEYNLGLENADMAIAGGLAQSQSLQAAGKQAMQSAYLNAAMSVAQGAYMYQKLNIPGGAPAGTPAPVQYGPSAPIVSAGTAGGSMSFGTNPLTYMP